MSPPIKMITSYWDKSSPMQESVAPQTSVASASNNTVLAPDKNSPSILLAKRKNLSLSVRTNKTEAEKAQVNKEVERIVKELQISRRNPAPDSELPEKPSNDDDEVWSNSDIDEEVLGYENPFLEMPLTRNSEIDKHKLNTSEDSYYKPFNTSMEHGEQTRINRIEDAINRTLSGWTED